MPKPEFVLGITAHPKAGLSPSHPQFFGRFQTRDFRTLAVEARKAGVKMVVYSPQAVSWRRGTIDGHQWQDGRWVEVRGIRIPHATINRAHGRLSQRESDLLSRQSAYLNPRELVAITRDKNATANILIKAGVRHPETMMLKAAARKKGGLCARLDESGSFYIKHRYGQHGLGVISVEANGRGVRLVYKTKDDEPPAVVETTRSNLDDAIRKALAHIARVSGKREVADAGRALVQAAIPTKKLEGRHWSARFVYTLTENGTPRGSIVKTGVGASVGGRGTYGSNHQAARGNLSEILESLYGRAKVGLITGKANEICRDAIIAMQEHLDKKPGSPRIGQVGIELAFDKHGNPHVIEINAAPSLGRLPKRHQERTCSAMLEGAAVQARLRGTYPR